MRGTHGHGAPPGAGQSHSPASRIHAAVVVRVLVCRQCGGLHAVEEVEDAGIGILARLARVGLGAGVPPVLTVDRGGR